MNSYSLTRRRHPANRGFALRELVIVIVVLGVLVAIAIPIYNSKRQRAHQQVALDKIRTMGGAALNYANQNGGVLPAEDADGNDTWDNATKPVAKDAWYNALPRLLGRKGTGDYAMSPEAFYTDENILFLPGANYPDKKKFLTPMFAFAFNTKLQRTGPNGEKEKTKLDQISVREKTVVFLEQGLLNEDRTLPYQSKNDYDGSPKGSPKSFVGRYDGQGVICFLDGRAELVNAKDLLTETGYIPFPQTNIIWSRTPEENPNKDPLAKSAKKKSKSKPE
jgi:prepilin-type N-terminal cleavage/methylation domain-containing protein